MVLLRCKQFFDLLTQNVNDPGIGKQFVMFDLSMRISLRIPLSKEYKYVTNNYTHIFLITTFLSVQLPSYCLLCTLLLSVVICHQILHLYLL